MLTNQSTDAETAIRGLSNVNQQLDPGGCRTVYARASCSRPGAVERKPRCGAEHTLSSWQPPSTLLSLSHRQGKPGQALTDRRDGPGEYLSPNDLCELNYTRGFGLHLPW